MSSNKCDPHPHVCDPVMAHRYIVAGVSPRSEGDGERDDECGGFNDGMDDEVEARVRACSERLRREGFCVVGGKMMTSVGASTTAWTMRLRHGYVLANETLGRCPLRGAWGGAVCVRVEDII